MEALGVAPNRTADIVRNRRRISADTALRLGLSFGNSQEFWMSLRSNYALRRARRVLSPEEAVRIVAHRAA